MRLMKSASLLFRDTMYPAVLTCVILAGMVMMGCGSKTVEMGASQQEPESVLFEAIAAGDLDTVQQEISADPALLNQRQGSYQQTPLHKAVLTGQIEIAQFLLENGALANVPDVFNQTPLTVALDNNADAGMVQLLRDYGADD